MLIETTDEASGRKRMELVNHPLVYGPGNRAGLFWFTISPLFADRVERPTIVLDPIWALPDQGLHAFGRRKELARSVF